MESQEELAVSEDIPNAELRYSWHVQGKACQAIEGRKQSGEAGFVGSDLLGLKTEASGDDRSWMEVGRGELRGR